ncbi:sulfite exporter TauE/SafE family protein [Mycolicibacterium hodleri]|uniref:Probable membrane transporter protein n=1 Tax=Mycolicibacterium hodleri TaxID=49897 RepID=A0A502E5T6_9MYCO|nr:sulfite exporter TauE/SafE family protein [Mycolicibacterium hodleri]TPG32714.1 sulfite exporter TauE/SafE family protein [Mycolicibacterium hodleri]
MIALLIALAVLVGVSLGLLGGGGSILTVPLLAYVAGMDARPAIATSLLVVGVTSTVSAITHAKAGRVQWRIAALFGAAAMAGAYTGGRLARFVPGTVLLIAFATIMIAAGIAMLLGRKDGQHYDGGQPLPLIKITIMGVGVGVISGLVGAGGGFLLVPALVLLTGLPMPVAVGTSLVIISMQSFAGFAGHITTEHIDWRLAAYVTAAAVVGALIGGRLVAKVDPATLRKLFGWFVLFMASLMLAEEIHPAVGITTAVVTLLAAAQSVACSRYGHCPLRRISRRRMSAAG